MHIGSSVTSPELLPSSPGVRPQKVQSQLRPTRSQATSLGSHSVLICERRRSTLIDPQAGHGGAGLVESLRNSSYLFPQPSQRYS